MSIHAVFTEMDETARIAAEGRAERGGGGLVVKQGLVAALAIATLAPNAARAAVLAAPTATMPGEEAGSRQAASGSRPVMALSRIGAGAEADTTVDAFDLGELLDGVGKVLASVDDPLPPSNPLLSGPAVGGGAGHSASAPARVRVAYDAADADAVTDPIPEPATWLMMILGFFGLSFAVRRRSAAAGTRVRFS